MIWNAKLLMVLGSLLVAGFVGVREYSAACGPKPAAADAHGHGNDHGGAAHANEGFGATACEEGLLNAVKHQLGFGGEIVVAVKSTAADPDADHGSATKPAAKTDNHGHDHGPQEKGGHDKEPHDGAAGKPAAVAKDDHGHGAGGHDEGGNSEGLVKLTSTQIMTTGIDMAPAASGKLVKEIAVPGRIVINANAQARVVPKLPGTVAKVMKQIGEPVTEGEVLASIESREMADAKAEYLAALRTQELAKSTYVREERLWKQKVTAEQDYLSAKNAHQEVTIKLDLAHQRLHTSGLSEDEITALPKQRDDTSTRYYDLRAPISGRVIARDLVLGQIVSTDKEVFSIADLAKVWVEMAVAPADLAFAREGQTVRVSSAGKSATAKVAIVSPVIDPETRAAKVVAELDNADGAWHLGDYVSAQLLSGEQAVALMVPREAVQTVKGAKAVFVNEDAGFRLRPVTTGREDSTNVEILSGLEFGETIATTNTFTLKAELGKAEAEHEH